MKKYYFILLTLLPFLSVAQNNYKSGYVINSKNDTVRGFINYREWEQNPKNITFKNNQSTDEKTFSPNDIKYFEVTGLEYYQSCRVNISLGSLDADKLTINADTTTKSDIVFLRIVQTGKNATLYTYNDDIKLRFYLLDKTMSTPQELLYRKYLNPQDRGQIITRNIYSSQLSAAASAGNVLTDKLSNEISVLRFDETDLKKLVAEINRGDGENPTKQWGKRGGVSFYGGIGLASSKLAYSGNAGSLPLLGTSSSSVSPTLSAGINVYINPNVRRLLLRFEANFWLMSYNPSLSANNPVTGSPNYSSQEVKGFDVSFSPQVLYNLYNTDALKAYLGVGIALNVSNYSTNQFTQTTPGFAGISYSDNPKLENFWVSLPIKAGVVIGKKFDLNLCYTPSSVVNTETAYNVTITSMQLGINYIFGK